MTTSSITFASRVSYGRGQYDFINQSWKYMHIINYYLMPMACAMYLNPQSHMVHETLNWHWVAFSEVHMPALFCSLIHSLLLTLKRSVKGFDAGPQCHQNWLPNSLPHNFKRQQNLCPLTVPTPNSPMSRNMVAPNMNAIIHHCQPLFYPALWCSNIRQLNAGNLQVRSFI